MIEKIFEAIGVMSTIAMAIITIEVLVWSITGVSIMVWFRRVFGSKEKEKLEELKVRLESNGLYCELESNDKGEWILNVWYAKELKSYSNTEATARIVATNSKEYMVYTVWNDNWHFFEFGEEDRLVEKLSREIAEVGENELMMMNECEKVRELFIKKFGIEPHNVMRRKAGEDTTVVVYGKDWVLNVSVDLVGSDISVKHFGLYSSGMDREKIESMLQGICKLLQLDQLIGE